MLRVSLLVYLAVLVVVLAAAGMLWVIAIVSGAMHGVDHFIQRLFGYQSFGFVWPELFLGVLVAGIILAVLGALANAFLAFVYNLVCEKVGGIELRVREEPRRPRRMYRREP